MAWATAGDRAMGACARFEVGVGRVAGAAKSVVDAALGRMTPPPRGEA